MPREAVVAMLGCARLGAVHSVVFGGFAAAELAKRIDDEEIKKCYDPKGIKIFCGDEGSIIIEDTFGLHKGVSPIKNSRMVLILIYGHGLGIDIYKNSLIKEYKN